MRRACCASVLRLLCLLTACARAAEVSLSDEGLPAGVRHAVGRLREVTDAPVSAKVGGPGLPLPGLAGAGEEAFAIAPEGAGYRVAANTMRGLMYGLLELRERLETGAPPKEPVVSGPALRLRGDVMDFPFYLGVVDSRRPHHRTRLAKRRRRAVHGRACGYPWQDHAPVHPAHLGRLLPLRKYPWQSDSRSGQPRDLVRKDETRTMIHEGHEGREE